MAWATAHGGNNDWGLGLTVLGFSSGHIREEVWARNAGVDPRLDASQATNLAHFVANRINAAGYGN